MAPQRPIICLSHLAWEVTLFQRPQQLMTRMAQRGHPVFYASKISTKRWLRDRLTGHGARNASPTAHNPRFLNSPWFPFSNRLSFLPYVEVASLRRRFLRWVLDQGTAPIVWLYHPRLMPFIDSLPHALLVYDVMDHFAGFRLSDREIRRAENELLDKADVVFTGGRALQEANVGPRPDAVCFPSGIDLDHFGKAKDSALRVPDDLRGMEGRILGYFGAIDERLDYELVRAVCRSHRAWHVVFLGPVIRGTSLTIEEPNFHWLGPKPYADLPAYLKAFDACLMPWVQTELTAHISPTKTPEYLAGGKPVVSVPIKDVVRDYGDVVFFGEGPDDFAHAIEKALAARGRDWAATLQGRPAARTWDQIAQEMDALIEAAERRKAGSATKGGNP